MVDVTGTIREALGDKTYALRLTMRGIATLQGQYGTDLGGLLTEGIGDDVVPDFNVLLDVVSVALQKGEAMDKDQADEIADDLLTKDKEIVVRIIEAAFPEAAQAEQGKSKAKGRKAA